MNLQQIAQKYGVNPNSLNAKDDACFDCTPKDTPQGVIKKSRLPQPDPASFLGYQIQNALSPFIGSPAQGVNFLIHGFLNRFRGCN